MADSSTAELVYLPLGGAGEIGMNCYLYGYGPRATRRWIMVDCGIGFGDMDTAPGVELVLPDIGFAFEIAEAGRLDGVFLTHAHEDHIGAVPHLWNRLKAPVYARAFTTEILRRKLREGGMDPGLVTRVELAQRVTAGPFSVEFLPITHSVPEASSLAIRSPGGTVLHTGDFKLDPEPQIGPGIDLAPFEALGREGVLAVACDSTNVFLDGTSGSESEIVENLTRLIAAAPGAVAATTFASNVARLKTLAIAAVQAGRSVVVAGRAMQRMTEAAVETGIMRELPGVVSEDRIDEIPAENLFYLVTGSQGENRAAMARIASGSHPTVTLKAGDTVLFSSKTIPGNESGIYRLYNRLSEQGITVIDGDMERVHVSGHARRDDLKRIYDAVRPSIALPMHGEHRHLVEHAKWAERWQIPHAVIAPNGSMVRLDAAAPAVVEHVEPGRIYLDGMAEVGAYDGVILERLKLARQGHVIVAVVTDEAGELLSDPQVKCVGAPRASSLPAPLDEMIAEAVDEAMEDAPAKSLRTDRGIEDVVGRATRRVTSRHWGKKPVVTILVTRLEEED